MEGDVEEVSKIYLWRWFVCLRRDHTRVSVFVRGFKGLGPENLEEDLWQSSPILRRVTHREVITRRGSCYVLEGPMDESGGHHAGVSQDILHLFRDGFPEGWTRAVSELTLQRERGSINVHFSTSPKNALARPAGLEQPLEHEAESRPLKSLANAREKDEDSDEDGDVEKSQAVDLTRDGSALLAVRTEETASRDGISDDENGLDGGETVTAEQEGRDREEDVAGEEKREGGGNTTAAAGKVEETKRESTKSQREAQFSPTIDSEVIELDSSSAEDGKTEKPDETEDASHPTPKRSVRVAKKKKRPKLVKRKDASIAKEKVEKQEEKSTTTTVTTTAGGNAKYARRGGKTPAAEDGAKICGSKERTVRTKRAGPKRLTMRENTVRKGGEKKGEEAVAYDGVTGGDEPEIEATTGEELATGVARRTAEEGKREEEEEEEEEEDGEGSGSIREPPEVTEEEAWKTELKVMSKDVDSGKTESDRSSEAEGDVSAHRASVEEVNGESELLTLGEDGEPMMGRAGGKMGVGQRATPPTTGGTPVTRRRRHPSRGAPKRTKPSRGKETESRLAVVKTETPTKSERTTPKEAEKKTTPSRRTELDRLKSRLDYSYNPNKNARERTSHGSLGETAPSDRKSVSGNTPERTPSPAKKRRKMVFNTNTTPRKRPAAGRIRERLSVGEGDGAAKKDIRNSHSSGEDHLLTRDGVKLSRSGRVILPVLQFWRNQTVRRGLLGVEDIEEPDDVNLAKGYGREQDKKPKAERRSFPL